MARQRTSDLLCAILLLGSPVGSSSTIEIDFDDGRAPSPQHRGNGTGDDAEDLYRRQPPKRFSGLTLRNFSDILFSEAENEFGSGVLSEEDATDLWDAAAAHGWSHAIMVENEAAVGGDRRRLRGLSSSGANSSGCGAQAPFIVCDPDEGKWGYNCHQDVVRYFGADIMPISNNENMTCYYVSTTATSASNAPSPFMVHPLLPDMKLQEDIAAEVSSLDAHQYRLYCMFCPGRAKSFDDAERIANAVLADIREEEHSERRRGRRSLSADVFLRRKGRRLLFGDDVDESEEPSSEETMPPAASRERSRHLLWASALDSEGQCGELFSKIELETDPSGESFTVTLPLTDELSSFPNAVFCVHSLVAKLSVRMEICSVGLVAEMRTMNQEAQKVIQGAARNELPFYAAGITGEGQVVAVSDSGLDQEHCYFWDGDGPVRTNGSIEPARRKVIQYYGYADGSDGRFGHGTHVVGSVCGRRSDNGRTGTTGVGDGIAYDAKVAFFDIGMGNSGYLRVPQSASQLFNPGKNAGANIHSCSWGSNFNGYGYEERRFDTYLRQNDKFMIVVAAGNSGSSRYTIGSPATFKNGLSVGASQNGGSHITNGMRGKDYLARFSSRGPTRDGRAKPDVVAPGEYIQSAAAGQSSCGENGLHFLAGTSMSAPIVSGALALVSQYYKDGFYPTGSRNDADTLDPSGQLLKCTVLNGAQYLSGEQRGIFGVDDLDPYDVNQNFGRVSLLDSLPLRGANLIGARVVDRKTIQAGRKDTLDVEIDTSGGCNAELSATLCWADSPGAPNCRQCVLDHLDLYLTKEGDSTTYFANGKNGRDDTNNAERVRVAANDGDKFTVHVEATNLEQSSQAYSLIVTGCLKDETSSDGGSTETTPPPPVPSPVPAPVPAPAAAPVPEPTEDPDGGANRAPGEQDSIETTLAGPIVWDGNMFDVEAKRDVVVSSVDIHTSSTFMIDVEVWTKPGSASGSLRNENAWSLVASTSVRGLGAGTLTPIPQEAFADGGVSVRAGETQAFYVTMQFERLIMTLGSQRGSVHSENGDLVIREGYANTFRFGQPYSPYIWNGAIHYSRDSSCNRGSIETLIEGGTRYAYFENLFDVSANVDITVTDLEIHTSSRTDIQVSVLTKYDTYVDYENDEGAWSPIMTGTVRGRGLGQRTPIPRDLFTSEVLIAAGTTQAFLVKILNVDSLRYSNGAGTYSNADMTITTGAANGNEGLFSPRTWNGVLHYNKECEN